MTRRLLCYFLLDTSGSMFGEPIQALNNGFNGLINILRTDPQAMDCLYISVITFDKDIKNIVPLIDLPSFQPVYITCPQSGPTHTGQALETVYNLAKVEVIKGDMLRKGDWRPLLFIFTDGKPSDIQKYRDFIPKIKQLGFGNIVACAAGPKADVTYLKELTDDVIRLDNADAATMSTYFKWVTTSIQMGQKSQGTGETITLPPPPSNINIIV